MVRVTTIKIKAFHLKLSVLAIIFIISMLVIKSSIISGAASESVISKVDVNYFKKALELTMPYKSNFELKLNVSYASAIRVGQEVLEYVTGFNISRPQSIFKYQLALINNNTDAKPAIAKSLEKTLKADNTQKDNENSKDAEVAEQVKSEAEITPIEKVVDSKGIRLVNETRYEINLDTYLNSKLNITKNKEGPQVLIYHTHTYESYTPSKTYNYVPSDTDRTSDFRYNVVRVGDEIANTLEKQYGINVIHDKTIHDADEYNRAYTKSEVTLKKYLEKYPNINLIIDLHRDAGITNGKKVRVASTINGKPAAKVMTVIGTDSRGLWHPYWRENLKMGVKLSQKMNELYPGLSRGIDLKLGRFNQFLSKNSVLIEVGSNGNTLDEAIESGKYISKVIAEVLKG